jgi:pimeloyl-ACP methyl ester carboxylesterase
MSIEGRTALRLADGRVLDMYDSGPPDGRVLLSHHGTPGCGLPSRSTADAAHRRGLRVVGFSRPGYGDSTRQPGRRVVDVAADAAAVLDAVGAERCLVIGGSGGLPHALACGARLAARVDAVAVMAGFAPYPAEGLDWTAGMGEANVVEFGKTLAGEAALRPSLDEQRAQILQADVAELVAMYRSLLPAADRALLTGEVGEGIAARFREAVRVGVDGWLDDDFAFARPWGFDLAEVAVPTALWHGGDDLAVPFAHGRWLAGRIPGVAAHLLEGEAHFSITIGKIDEILRELVRAGDARNVMGSGASHAAPPGSNR